MSILKYASRPVFTLAPENSIDRAIGLMEEYRFRHLPVVASDEIVGIVSDRDILLSSGWESTDERRSSDNPGQLAGPQRVEQIMSRPVVTIDASATPSRAAALMLEKRIGALPVLEHGRLAGIIAEGDLLRYAQRTQSPTDQPVHAVMRDHVVRVRPDAPVEEMVDRLRDHHIRHLIIADGDRLVGIASDRDVRRALGRALVEDEKAENAGTLYLDRITAADVMSPVVAMIGPDASLAEAANRMVEHHIHSLPVIDEKPALVGILTSSDILATLTDRRAKAAKKRR